MFSYLQEARELLVGGYDLHIHPWPDHDERSVNDFQLIDQAEKLGMAGILVKNHYEPTTSRAHLVNLYHKGKTKMYGSITLNWSVGGVNPYAVESAAKMDAKMIWLPTRESEASMHFGALPGYIPRTPLRIIDEEGRPIKELLEVLEIARDYDIPISTGHISTKESFVVCELGIKMGVCMVLSHPEYSHTFTPVDVQQQFAQMGVLIEKDWVNIALEMATIEDVADSIRIIGANNIYIASDRGQVDGETPAEGILMYIAGLLKNGISKKDIKTMTCDNPMAVLRI